MKWKLLPGGFLVLCEILTLTRAGDENTFEGDATKQGVQVPLQALKHLADPTATSPYNDNGTDGPDQRGVLGSSCNSSADCDYPGLCWSDGYCHCWNGHDYDGICFTTSLTWSSTLAFSAAGVVFFIAICILAVNCFKQPSWRNYDMWRCQCCRAVVNGRQRRGSCEKTPAFTMQAHYASQELCSPGEEVQESSTYGLGGAVPRRHRTSTVNNATVSDFSSANTYITTVNESFSERDTAHTSPPPPPSLSPAPSPPHSPPCASLSSPLPFYSFPSSSSPTNSPPLITSPTTSSHISGSVTSVLPPHTPSSPVYRDSSNSRDENRCCESYNSNTRLTEASRLRPSTSKSSSETTSVAIGALGGCTHERCQLCLPKPPSSTVGTPSRRKSNNFSINGESPPLPSTDTLHANSSIELTQF